ncbi:Metalloendoprotein 1 precursor [Dorcoceras hygrometricum]|uniref:Metalloendoprotein 1 n=1 Tax=Dorcoceras hygrometricum TaxID=472368 RepID=A0A2Z7BT11_9LAMI|nr:Metalloendoprotein 1 precursor [Dorcoceras hygrometricum]
MFSGVLRKGDDHNPKLVHELKKHFVNLGYLHPNKLGNETNFDNHLENAIKQYQEFYSLKVTGVVDINMITSLRIPRCGVPDFSSSQTHFKSLYTLFPGTPRWDKIRLTYHMDERVTESHKAGIVQALRAWEYVTHFRFYYMSEIGDTEPDIKISFKRGDHGCDNPFSETSIGIAHSFPPPDGRVHFNAHKAWATDGTLYAFDVFTTALHELGHVLGLDHSTNTESIMFPTIVKGQRKYLHSDDIDGINALYNIEK